MDNYITQYQAAAIIGISRARVSQLVSKGQFIKGKLVYNKHAKKEVMQFRLKDVEKYAKNRASS